MESIIVCRPRLVGGRRSWMENCALAGASGQPQRFMDRFSSEASSPDPDRPRDSSFSAKGRSELCVRRGSSPERILEDRAHGRENDHRGKAPEPRKEGGTNDGGEVKSDWPSSSCELPCSLVGRVPCRRSLCSARLARAVAASVAVAPGSHTSEGRLQPRERQRRSAIACRPSDASLALLFLFALAIAVVLIATAAVLCCWLSDADSESEHEDELDDEGGRGRDNENENESISRPEERTQNKMGARRIQSTGGGHADAAVQACSPEREVESKTVRSPSLLEPRSFVSQLDAPLDGSSSSSADGASSSSSGAAGAPDDPSSGFSWSSGGGIFLIILIVATLSTLIGWAAYKGWQHYNQKEKTVYDRRDAGSHASRQRGVNDDFAHLHGKSKGEASDEMEMH